MKLGISLLHIVTKSYLCIFNFYDHSSVSKAVAAAPHARFRQPVVTHNPHLHFSMHHTQASHTNLLAVTALTTDCCYTSKHHS